MGPDDIWPHCLCRARHPTSPVSEPLRCASSRLARSTTERRWHRRASHSFSARRPRCRLHAARMLSTLEPSMNADNPTINARAWSAATRQPRSPSACMATRTPNQTRTGSRAITVPSTLPARSTTTPQTNITTATEIKIMAAWKHTYEDAPSSPQTDMRMRRALSSHLRQLP